MYIILIHSTVSLRLSPQMADRAKSELGWCQPSIDQTEVFWKIKFQQRINKATKDMINIDHTCIMEMEWDTCSFWRPGLEKTGKTGSSLQGNFVIWRKKIEKYIRETLPHWREIYPAGSKFLPSLQGNNNFFQACVTQTPLICGITYLFLKAVLRQINNYNISGFYVSISCLFTIFISTLVFMMKHNYNIRCKMTNTFKKEFGCTDHLKLNKLCIVILWLTG